MSYGNFLAAQRPNRSLCACMLKFGQSIVGVGLVVSACIGSEVTYTGAKHPSKPAGCPVKIFPSTTPDYKWEDIATVESHCHFTMGRSACIEELKKRTCEAGGDTLYGFKDGKQGEAIIVIGTVGIQTGGSAEKIGGEPPKAPAESAGEAPKEVTAAASSSCDPPCSPGYRCEASQCIAVCNPPCGEGMRCNQQRMCESAAAPAP